MKFSLLLLGLGILFVGCATDVANRYYAHTTYPPKDPEQVDLLFSAPSRKYEVIADFQSRNESPESIRKKAAKIGADGVIVALLGGYYSQSETWASSDTYSNTYSRITGTAIKYK